MFLYKKYHKCKYKNFLTFKNNLTKDNIIGYNDFFELIGHHQTSEKEWANIWYEIGTYILDETRRIEEAA